jgi:hypothetical protein
MRLKVSMQRPLIIFAWVDYKQSKTLRSEEGIRMGSGVF